MSRLKTKGVLIISNKGLLSKEAYTELDNFYEYIVSGGSPIYLFKEDTKLYRHLYGRDNVHLLSGLTGNSDKLIYLTNINQECVRSEYLQKLENEKKYAEVYSNGTSRYPLPNKDSCINQVDYNNKRTSTVSKRLKHNMTKIGESFDNIIIISNIKQHNLVNTLKPESNDGKKIHIFDDTKNIALSYVGGMIIPREILIKFYKGEHTH